MTAAATMARLRERGRTPEQIRRLALARGDAELADLATRLAEQEIHVTATETTETGLLMVKLTDIQPSPLNRRLSDDDTSIASMAQSMKEQGLLQPIVLRPVGCPQTGYEIVCGERRWRAARVLGWDAIPAIVRELGEKDAHVARLVENLQRQDVPPLEQSDGVAALLEQHGGSAEEVAARLGVSPAWVYLRAKLRNLSETWRRELADPDTSYDRLAASVTWQEVLAALPQDVQDEIWKSREIMNCMTLATLRERIGARLRRLDSAPWSAKQEHKLKSPQGGIYLRCKACDKRTDREPGLFADLVELQGTKAGACCLDQECWERKTTAWIRLQAMAAKDEHGNLVAVMSGWSDERKAIAHDLGLELYPSYRWEDSKRTDDQKLVMAIRLDGDDAGKVLSAWVDQIDDDDADGDGDGQSKEDEEEDHRAHEANCLARNLLRAQIKAHWPCPSLEVDEDEPEDLDCQLMAAAMLAATVGHGGIDYGHDVVAHIQRLGNSRRELLDVLTDGCRDALLECLYSYTANDCEEMRKLLAYPLPTSSAGARADADSEE